MYRPMKRPRVAHTWRTRKDPFEAVWPELKQRLHERPEITAKVLFKALQQRYPGQRGATQHASTPGSGLAHGTGGRVIRTLRRVAVDRWTRFAGSTYPQHDDNDNEDCFLLILSTQPR